MKKLIVADNITESDYKRVQVIRSLNVFSLLPTHLLKYIALYFILLRAMQIRIIAMIVLWYGLNRASMPVRYSLYMYLIAFLRPLLQGNLIMIKLHIRPGEYIYFTERSSNEVMFKILLVEFAHKEIEVGLFDCSQSKTPDMEVKRFSFGERTSLFRNNVSINGLKAEYQGVNFAVDAVPRFFIDNDFLRRKKMKWRQIK